MLQWDRMSPAVVVNQMFPINSYEGKGKNKETTKATASVKANPIHLLMIFSVTVSRKSLGVLLLRQSDGEGDEADESDSRVSKAHPLERPIPWQSNCQSEANYFIIKALYEQGDVWGSCLIAGCGREAQKHGKRGSGNTC